MTGRSRHEEACQAAANGSGTSSTRTTSMAQHHQMPQTERRSQRSCGAPSSSLPCDEEAECQLILSRNHHKKTAMPMETKAISSDTAFGASTPATATASPNRPRQTQHRGRHQSSSSSSSSSLTTSRKQHRFCCRTKRVAFESASASMLTPTGGISMMQLSRLLLSVVVVMLPLVTTTSAQITSASSVNPLAAVSTQVAQGREIQQRVFENVDHFMNAPVLATKITNRAYDIHAFPHYLQPLDRNHALSHFYVQAISMKLKVYYGLESGTTVLITDDLMGASYRESGNSGYDLNDPAMQHYRNVCVNRDTGATEECAMGEGDKYVSCTTENCDDLFPCPEDPDDASEATATATASNCTSTDTDCVDGTVTTVDSKASVQRWCRDYTFEKVKPGEQLGYLPRSYSCFDNMAQFSQTPGEIIYPDPDDPDVVKEDGTCTFRGGSLVSREVSGPFAYCGNPMDPTKEYRAPIPLDSDGNVDSTAAASVTCDNTFAGVYRTRDYDPRMRSWFTTSKAKLRPFWTEPYVFFSSGSIGITWTEPLFQTDAAGRSVFEGVLCVDYKLDQISGFLEEAYLDSSTFIAVYEATAPYYMIGSSKSSPLSKKVLADDPTQPCPIEELDDVECDVVRLSITDLEGDEANNAMRNAHVESLAANFPSNEFVAVKADVDAIDSKAYVAESILYEHPKANLQWRIMVVTPIQRSDQDTILQSDQLFYPLIFVATMGCFICLGFAVGLYKYRGSRAVIHADYRFTMAFIVFCCILNVGMYTMLGKNTNELCMLRYWSLFFLSSLAVSPLIVKIYRMYRLVGATAAFQKVKISNFQAMLYTIPIPLIQGICLFTFAFVDPYKQKEILELESGVPVQRIICGFESRAFWITEGLGTVTLLLGGCILAYLTRNLDPRFGEAKQLIFSIYNIAFTGLIIAVILYLVGVTQQAERALLTISVFWGTSLSSAAFVLPRILQARQAIRNSRHNGGSSTRFGNGMTVGGTYVSGLQGHSVVNFGTTHGFGMNRGMDDAGSSSNGNFMMKQHNTMATAASGRSGNILPRLTDDRLAHSHHRTSKHDQFDDSSHSGDVEMVSPSAGQPQQPSSSGSSSTTTSPSSSTPHPHGEEIVARAPSPPTSTDTQEAEDRDAVAPAISFVMPSSRSGMVGAKDPLASRISEPESVHFDGDRCSWHARDVEDQEGDAEIA